MTRRRLTIVVAGVLLAAAIAWLASNFERVPARIYVGPSSESRLHPFLAAERFASRMGLQSREMRSLPELDALSGAGALLLQSRRQAFDAARVDRIVGWIERGGHLIVEAELIGVSDPLLDRLGVKRLADPLKPDPAPRTTTVPVNLQSSGKKLAASLLAPMKLEPPAGDPIVRAGAAGATKLVTFARGKGAVTAAVSLNFARNPAIGDHDHAELLWQLLQVNGARALHVLFNPERLSLWKFLVEHAWTALVPSVALLILWLWRIAPRFGPIVPDAPPARRRLLDHLRASGRYYWANDLRGRLVEAAREAALRRIARAQPDFSGASRPEQAARLAEFAGLSTENAGELLAAEGAARGADFIRLMHHAQRVHAAAERGEPRTP